MNITQCILHSIYDLTNFTSVILHIVLLMNRKQNTGSNNVLLDIISQ